MSEQVGPVREEAERLAAAVLARLTVAVGAGWPGAVQNPERAQRLARATGDVGVAVTGLLRELAGAPGRSSRGPIAALGLREAFLGLTRGLLDAAGVDPHADPPPPQSPPWRTGHPAPAGSTRPAGPGGDAWRAATRADWRGATGGRREEGRT